jgi:U3 small nucleolar RNA-associated protein 19
MRIINERATHLPGDDTQVWLSGLFKNVFEAVVEAKNGQALRSEFLDHFAKAYEDVRYYTFVQVSYVSHPSSPRNPAVC